MQCALGLAREAEAAGEVPVGAVVVLNEEIIGRGFNRTITSQDPTAHAEMVAIRNAAATLRNYRLVDAQMYSTIEPCSMCAGAIVHARISDLHYAAPEPRSGAAGSSIDVFGNPGLNHKVAIHRGCCEAEAAQLITDFFKARR